MNTVFESAGKFAAHAIWCVSDGSTLVPMFVANQNGESTMHRIATQTLEQAVATGQGWLETGKITEQDERLLSAALLYEIRLTLGTEKMDAIAIDLRDYEHPESKATLCIPFTPKKGPMGLFGKFKVHRPKMTKWEKCDHLKTEEVLEAFWKGVDSHEQGAKVWNQAMDQSK